MNHNNKNDPAIPTLDDLVAVDRVNQSKTEPAGPQEGTGASASSQAAGNKPLPRDNPFLPYEHLEQLARERAEFQKQFVQFSLAQQNKQNSGSTAASDGSHQAAMDLLTKQLTDRVLTDMRPQIEKRIRELIREYQTDLSRDRK